jgi:hypothetical protein
MLYCTFCVKYHCHIIAGAWNHTFTGTNLVAAAEEPQLKLLTRWNHTEIERLRKTA